MDARRIVQCLRCARWCGIVLVGVAAVYLGLGTALVSAVGEPILGTTLLDGAVIVLAGAARLARPRWLAQTAEPKAVTRHVAWTFAGCAVLAFLAGQALGLWLYSMIGSDGFDESIRARHAAGAMLTLLLTLVLAPVAEELVFRGLIYPLLRTRVDIIPSVLLSAGVFGLVHGNSVQFASVLPLAVLLSLVYEHTRVLWPCVLLHLGFNLVATVVPAPALAGFGNPVPALMLTTAFAGCVVILYPMIAGSTATGTTARGGDRGPGEAG